MQKGTYVFALDIHELHQAVLMVMLLCCGARKLLRPRYKSRDHLCAAAQSDAEDLGAKLQPDIQCANNAPVAYVRGGINNCLGGVWRADGTRESVSVNTCCWPRETNTLSRLRCGRRPPTWNGG
jgi:hypothetical protein